MTSPIDRLHKDHAHFAQLLRIVERELDRIEALEHEDHDLMLDVMSYITRYSDRVHHPTEDLLYARLADKSPRARTSLAEVPRDHEALLHEGSAFKTTLTMIADGGMVLREDILVQGRAYLDHLRRHMVLEEEHLFPMARTVLDEADLAEVDQILNEQRDPIFGDVVESDFADLYQHIQREQAQ